MNAAAFAIHSEIHRARPDVTAIAHAHTRSGRAWSATGRLLEPLSQDACAFYDDHARLRRLLRRRVRHRRRRRAGAGAGRQEGAAPPAPRPPHRRRDRRRGRVLVAPARTVLRGAARCSRRWRRTPTARRRTDRSLPTSPRTRARRWANTCTAGWGSSRSARRSSGPTRTSSVSHTVDHRSPKGLSCRTASCCGPPATWRASPGGPIVEHPNMELVGAYAWSPEKAGRDVGELIGIEPIGITATSDVDELLALTSGRRRLLPDHAHRGDPRARRHDLSVPRGRGQRRQHRQPDHRPLVGRRAALRRRRCQGRRIVVRQRREPRLREPAHAHRHRCVQRGDASCRCGRRPSARATTRPSSGRRWRSATTRRSPTSTSTSTRAPRCSRTPCR